MKLGNNNRPSSKNITSLSGNIHKNWGIGGQETNKSYFMHHKEISTPPMKVKNDVLDYGTNLFFNYMKFLPVLWILGAILPAAALMLTGLSLLRWSKSKLVNVVMSSWIMVGLFQAAAALFNGIYSHQLMLGVANMFSFSVIGWFFGAMAIAIGASYQLNTPKIIRSYTLVGSYIIPLSTLALIGRMAGIETMHLNTPPLALILPDIPTVSFYMQTLVYQTESTLGELSTRLILFFPWATALGLGGLAIAFVSILEENIYWRITGVTGGIIGVIFSVSRIAIATLIFVSVIILFIRMGWFKKIIVSFVIFFSLMVSIVNGFDPSSVIDKLQNEANNARAGSSQARELIYQKSWEGFLESPYMGNGWIGPSVHKKEVLPIGSHSTIYGLAYTGGIFTLGSFFLAMSITLIGLIYRVYQTKNENREGAVAVIGIALCLCLIIYSPYEALFNLTIPCIFLFTWIGAALSDEH
jgi:hypothetical protein